MPITTKEGEKHLLIKVEDAYLTDEVIQAIQEKILSLWEVQKQNMVLYFPNLDVDEPTGMSFLKDLSDQAMENGCSLVLAGSNQVLQYFADENVISYAETQEEAVDLVLIEGIERQLNEGEDPGLT